MQAWDASFLVCLADDRFTRGTRDVRRRLSTTSLQRRAIRLIVAATLAFRLTIPSAHAAPPFSISSPDFMTGTPLGIAQIGVACTGMNHSPALQWQNAPAGTTSFAITFYDRDAPGHGWWFWAVAGIPASIHQLSQNAAASGALAALGAVQARNDAGDDGYTGPCSPSHKRDASTLSDASAASADGVTAPNAEAHRLILTVYALKGPVGHVAQGLPAPFFEHEIANDAIAQASIEVRTVPPIAPEP